MAQGTAGVNILSNEISFGDSPSVDAFSRVRVSSGRSLFDAQLTYNLQPLLFEQVTNGTGASVAHSSTERYATMTFSSTTTGGKAYMQTYEHFRYTAGKSQLVFITFNMNSGVANVLKFAGYSNGTNGIELQLDGTTAQFKIYSGTSLGAQTTTQSNWNLDKMDGTGASGITLDFSKTQILVIDFQALYVGRVRLGFDVGGNIVYAHEFLHANSAVYPYLQSANLPVRCGMTCTGTVTTTMHFVCCTVQSEDGGYISEGFKFALDNNVTAASGSRTHLMSLQPRTTFNSITNRAKFILEDINILVTGINLVKWELCLGDVITGTTTFNDVNTTYSTMAYNFAGTTSGSPSIVVASGFVQAAASSKGASNFTIPMKYPITLDSAGAARALGRLTLLVTGLGGTSATYGAINWTEIR